MGEKRGLRLSDVDMGIYRSLLTRAAETSKIKDSSKLSSTLKTAGWRRSQAFAKFYDKVVEDKG